MTAFAWRLGSVAASHDVAHARRLSLLTGAYLLRASASVVSGPTASPSSAPELGVGAELPTPSPPSASAQHEPRTAAVPQRRAPLRALHSRASDVTEKTTRGEAAVAHPLLSPRSNPSFPAALAHDADLPSLEAIDTLPAGALPGVVADLAARQAHLAALQARAAARLAIVGTRSTGSEHIAPGQRLDAEQLAARMGRSVDYVYRHADDWPFTVREGRSVTFDEAGFVRWQQKRTAANGARRREVP